MLTDECEFALDILVFGDRLNAQHKFVVANQIIESGTAVGALIHEAQFAESKLDSIHKLRLTPKEANETLYWLELCEQTNDYLFTEALTLCSITIRIPLHRRMKVIFLSLQYK